MIFGVNKPLTDVYNSLFQIITIKVIHIINGPYTLSN